MAAVGIDFGAHTVNHTVLPLADARTVHREIVESKKVIEDKIGVGVRWFAYPFGGVQHFRPGLASYVEEAGYDGCLSGYGGFIYADSDRRLLPREAVPYLHSVLNLELHLRGCLDWLYAVKRRLGLMGEPPQVVLMQEQAIKAQSDPLMCISSGEPAA